MKVLRQKLRRKLLDFPTKTVPDGVHDGEDEVEAVADVEGDQDVVEAVAHLFPWVQDACFDSCLLFLKVTWQEQLY